MIHEFKDRDGNMIFMKSTAYYESEGFYRARIRIQDVETFTYIQSRLSDLYGPRPINWHFSSKKGKMRKILRQVRYNAEEIFTINVYVNIANVESPDHISNDIDRELMYRRLAHRV